jgi:mannan polymerase II complex MNN10 subunit
MIYSNSDGNWGNDLMQKVIQNREDYAKRHEYTVVTANEMVDKSRPAAWSKLRAMDHYLYQFDYLMYIDMDAVIMHPLTPLSVFINLSPTSDFIMTEDWNGVNTGIWLAKNTDFAHWFLKTAWNQTQLIPKKSKEGISHPFEYEQRAFHFLLNTEIWQQRHLPHYRGDIEEIRKHFFLLPQCAFNSYIMHPLYWHGDRETSQYVEGDFLVHFAGKKGRIKTNLMKYYLDEASRKKL